MSQMLATSVEVRRRSPIWFWVNTVLAVLILVPAGIGFGMKFRELVLLYESYLSQREKEGGWAQPGPMPAAAPPPAPVAVTAPEADGVVPAQPGVVGMVREVGRSSRRQYTETEASDGGFAVAPILNYLLVSLGFFLLFLAAIF
ncbi:MAG TPA: hypothetical protein PKC45_08300, partial [Gemmatales bacterium]|nr:hypothetical protein [Gemmatales bacterium]